MKMTVHPKEKFVGLFVLIAVLLSVLIVYLNVRSALDEKFILRLELPKTYGLQLADKVKLRGLSIGEVYAIDISRNIRTNEDNIEVLMRISEKKYIAIIKRDSQVSVEPALGPLPASLEIHPGIEEELLPNNSDIRLKELPTTSIEGMVGDVAESIKTFKEVSRKLSTEGLTSILGPEIQEDIKFIQKSVNEIIAELHGITDDANVIVNDLRNGDTTVSQLAFGERPLLEVVLGTKAQKRIDDLNSDEHGILEWLVGPRIWSEIESASQSWEPLSSAVLDLMTEGKIVMQKSQDIISDIHPVLEMITENRVGFHDLLSSTNKILSDVQEITKQFVDEKDQIPMTIRQLRDVISNIDSVTKAVNKHWLLAPYTTVDPADSNIPVKSYRPNHYNE